MKNRFNAVLMLVAFLGFVGCAGMKPVGPEQAKPMPEPQRVFTEAPEEPATNGLECFVKIYSGTNFGGASVTLRPADSAFVKYSDLENVAEARGTNWGKEAKSVEVGKCARAEAFSQTNFRGASQTLEPGYSTEDISQSNVSSGINSIKITCTCTN